MSTYSLTLRGTKGSKLTISEMDNNLLYLESLSTGGNTPIQNIIQVKKGTPGIGEFSSIKDAVDSITTSSTTNQFLIKVGPGVYVEDTITMKTGISIISDSLGTSRVRDIMVSVIEI